MDPELLSEFRRRMNWTQRICARYIGVDVASWKNWESGKRGQTHENARRLRSMVKLSETDEGRSALRAWAADCAARRAARWEGRSSGANLRTAR